MRCIALLATLAMAAAASAPPSTARPTLRRDASEPSSKTAKLRRLIASNADAIVHLAIVLCLAPEPLESVRTDQWLAIRRIPPDTSSRRGAIFRRRRRAAQVGATFGLGYTPRITFLAGMMLRSLQMTTRIREVFDPSTGYAAGAMLGAHFSQREWLPVILCGCTRKSDQ